METPERVHPEHRPAVTQPVDETFCRKSVDVREVFRDYLVGFLVDGKVVDKEKLEQVKLRISARLVNFVVGGGVLLFRELSADKPEHAGPAVSEDQAGTAQEPQVLERPLDEVALFSLLEKTILKMLAELNEPDVNLLKISMNKSFRQHMENIFSPGKRTGPGQFPVKIFHDIHADMQASIGINMRNTRSLGEDINRIERQEHLMREILERRRPLRHTDSDLYKLLSL